LLVGWCLVQLAWHQHVTPALLLPLYYLADAAVTLFRRIARREPFWRRIAAISISAPPTTAFRCGAS
jgi:hypothetical protein